MPTAPLVFVGTATHDTIAFVDRYPDADERVLVDDLVTAGGGPAATAAVAAARLAGGGPAATAAVAAARLGRHVAFVGSVGDDEPGEAILAGLEAEGVDTSGVARRHGRSATSVVVVARTGATRAILHRPADSSELSETGWATIAAARWLHVDQAGWPIVDGWWRASPSRPQLSVDAGNPVEGVSLADVDLYVPTVSALRRRYGDRSTEQLLGAALADGARSVVATDGVHGATAVGPSVPLFHVPALRGEVRSTLGAGDVFHGALLAALDRGFELRQAVEYAGAVAFTSCAGLDGRSAIPDHERTLSVLRSRAAHT